MIISVLLKLSADPTVVAGLRNLLCIVLKSEAEYHIAHPDYRRLI